MAEPATDLLDQVAGLDPKSAAQQLIDAKKQHRGWLDEFSEQLDLQMFQPSASNASAGSAPPRALGLFLGAEPALPG